MIFHRTVSQLFESATHSEKKSIGTSPQSLTLGPDTLPCKHTCSFFSDRVFTRLGADFETIITLTTFGMKTVHDLNHNFLENIVYSPRY